MLSAHGTERILSLKLNSTVVADTEMATRHDKRIFLFKEADLAAGFFVIVVLTNSLLCFSSAFLLAKAENGFDFERHSFDLYTKVSLSLITYQHDLLVYFNSFNFVLSV